MESAIKRVKDATNDSNQSHDRSKTHSRKEMEIYDLEHRLISNDLTFNQKPTKNNHHNDYKSIKSEESSFSSALIK